MKWKAGPALLLAAAVLVADQPGQPPVSISLGSRRAEATPRRVGFTHTGGGNIHVSQPSPDALAVTMTGVAVAGAHPTKASMAELVFELAQDFEVVINDKKVNRASLSVEARLVGLLRSHQKGAALVGCPGAVAVVPAGGGEAILAVAMPERSVAGGSDLSVNDQQGPASTEVVAGKFVLYQRLGILASHPRSVLPCKAASAEFAPGAALDPLWISAWEPFRGAEKKDFGFQVTVRVSAVETGAKESKAGDGAKN